MKALVLEDVAKFEVREMSAPIMGAQDVRKCKPGDRVVADQVLNCHSKGRVPVCEYCETGDSHQCAFGEELGITGLPGAFAELASVPETNVVVLPAGMSLMKGAIIEPL